MFPTEYQEPTYNTAIQVVQMIRMLESTSRQELPIREIAEKLEVHQRTVKRYVDAIGSVVTNDKGVPMLQRVKHGRTPYARLNLAAAEKGAGIFEYAALHLASQHLITLDPNVMGELLVTQLEDMSNQLRDDLREKVARVKNAFYYLPFGPKSYSQHESQLNALVRAIISRQEVALSYPDEEMGGMSERVFQPFTLVAYRDALYAYGRKRSGKRYDYRFYQVDRIGAVRLLKEKFNVPKDYNPEDAFRTTIGIWQTDAKPVDVKIRFTHKLNHHLKNREWPGLQSFRPDDNRRGWDLLHLKVPITPELETWIASWGANAEVLEPDSLRDTMRDYFADALELYLD